MQIFNKLDPTKLLRSEDVGKILVIETDEPIPEKAFCLTDVEKVVITGKVSQIGARAFYGCKKLETVILEEGITEIQEEAFFECSSLKEVKFEKGLESIRKGAFERCFNLEKVTFNDDLRIIGENAFFSTALKEVVFPENLSHIGDSAFCMCIELIYVEFQKSNVVFGTKFCPDPNNKKVDPYAPVILCGEHIFSQCNSGLKTKGYKAFLNDGKAIPTFIAESIFSSSIMERILKKLKKVF